MESQEIAPIWHTIQYVVLRISYCAIRITHDKASESYFVNRELLIKPYNHLLSCLRFTIHQYRLA